MVIKAEMHRKDVGLIKYCIMELSFEDFSVLTCFGGLSVRSMCRFEPTSVSEWRSILKTSVSKSNT